MKRTQKRILGFSGLALVIGVTIFAAFLPNPEVLAASSVTDTVIIRVISGSPSAEITGLASGSTIISADQHININFDHLRSYDVVVKFKDKDGNEHTKIVRSGPTEDETGTYPLDFIALSNEFGFGEYTIIVEGEGTDGSTIPGDSIEFSYYPVIAAVDKDAETGLTYLNLDYEPYEEGGPGKVSKLEINIYDENGKLMTPISPIVVYAPNTRVEIPFEEYELESGKYRLEITAFNPDNEDLYTPYNTSTDYNAIPVPDAGTPDTGGLFGSLNISKIDYLATGLLIFSVVGISAFVFIVKRSHRNNKRRR